MSSGFSFMNALLSFPAAGYYAVQKVREKAYGWGMLSQQTAPVPVISVGNLLLGGTGKTPFVIYLAEMLRNRGMKPAVVSRGYRGTNRDPYLVVGDGLPGQPLADPEVCGDEPYLIAMRLPEVPVIVGHKRIYPVRAAREMFGCNVVVLDDGFQHLPLKRDADVVLLNGSEDHMFPWGRLREPLSALKRADIIMVVADGAVRIAAASYVQGPVFRCRAIPSGLARGSALETLEPADAHSGREVVLVSGIANPDRFHSTAEKLGWTILDHFSFPDHHRFTDDELRSILGLAAGLPVVATEKDWVKLPPWFKEMDQVAALRIEMVLDNEEAFWAALKSLVPALDAT
jgi:tetraacyldisaccharide 4'-kinase